MVILHIAHIKNELFSGVAVVVPQHVNAQSEFAQVGFLNASGETIPSVKNQLAYRKGMSLSELPMPFCTPDLIVFHEVYYPVFLSLSKQAREMSIPYIVVPHGCLTYNAQRKKKLKKIAGNILLFNRFIREAQSVQYLSEQERRTSNFGRRAFVGTNGIGLPPKRKEIFSGEKIRFLYIGRLDLYHKGLDMMFEVIRSSVGIWREKNCEFYIYGPDENGKIDELRELADRYGLKDFIKLSGAVSGAEKENALLNCDIFIQTSRFEGMPMGVLEALSYGIPCLVTRGTNLGEIIEEYDAGWVAETNVESIGEGLLKAVDERDRWAEKSENAVRLVEENFRWSKVAEAAVSEYRRIIGK